MTIEDDEGANSISLILAEKRTEVPQPVIAAFNSILADAPPLQEARHGSDPSMRVIYASESVVHRIGDRAVDTFRKQNEVISTRSA